MVLVCTKTGKGSHGNAVLEIRGFHTEKGKELGFRHGVLMFQYAGAYCSLNV